MLAQHQLDRLLAVEEDDRLVGIVAEADLRRDEGRLGIANSRRQPSGGLSTSGDPPLWMNQNGSPRTGGRERVVTVPAVGGGVLHLASGGR
jgi:hypothetical protein